MKKCVIAVLALYVITQAGFSQTITGSGTSGTLPKFSGATSIGNSQIIDNGTTIGIGGGTIPVTNPPKLYSYGPGAYFDIPNNATYQGNNKALFKINRPSTLFENFLSFCEGGANKWAIGMDDEASGNFYLVGNPAGTVLTATTSGNVGIGTTAPSSKLHVNGSTTLDGTIKFPTISSVDFGGGTSGNYSVLLRDNNNQLVRTSIGNIVNTLYAAGPADLDPNLCLGIWDPITCTSGYTTTPTWKNISGSGNIFVTCANVGIGTSTPHYALEVSGSSKISGNIGVGIAPKCTTKIYSKALNTSDEFLRFDNSTGTQFKVDNSGFLTCRDILVTLNAIPDYVFEPNYQLLSLKEVEEYISENKHLPNVPSADEMVANGTTLGEVNMKLLEKVEELTLYIIQLEKRISEIEQNKVNK